MDTVTDFDVSEDSLSFAGTTNNGTIAEVAVTNDAGTALGNIALSATNTTVYVFDTDATEIGTATAAAITDFTSMTVVAAFLNTGDGVTASDTEDKVDYFIINDGGTGNAYVYKFVDDGDTTSTIEATELTLIANIDKDADAGAITVANVDLA